MRAKATKQVVKGNDLSQVRAFHRLARDLLPGVAAARLSMRKLQQAWRGMWREVQACGSRPPGEKQSVSAPGNAAKERVVSDARRSEALAQGGANAARFGGGVY